MADINIYGTLKSQTGDGKLALASEIYDAAKGKFQSEINQDGGSSAAYETIDIGEQSNYTGTFPDGYYTISYSGNLYNAINAIWASGKIPVLKMILSSHTSSYSIPLYKAPDNDFDGHDRAENGSYTVDADVSSSQQRIYTRSVGTYTKPSGGIPKTDLAQVVQNTLDKAENLDTELDETSTNAVQNKVITKELNDNYAKKDGFYESMGVGTAVNLAGQVERTNDSLYRTSGGTEDIATGTARIEAIKGQTIAWNQCVNVTDGSSSSKGVTISHQDGVLSVNGAFDGTSASVDLGRFEFKCVDTHKYYIDIPNKLMSDNVLCNIGGNSFLYTYDNIKDIKTASVTKNNAYVLFRYTTPNVTLSGSTTINIFDLTLIYGEGNEPSTPEQFEADYQRWFGKPLTYEPYDAGSLKNVMLDGLKTIGFNQWDEEWEDGAMNTTTGMNIANNNTKRSKNFINVLPNTQYYCFYNGGTGSSVWCLFYDLNMDVIEGYKTGRYYNFNASNVKDTIFSTPSNCKYIRFYCTKDTEKININLSWSGVKDGTYEHYEENTISIPTTTMTGKLNGEGESVVIFPDGMKGVNDVHDEIYYVGDKTYAVKRIGRVDLGSLSWNKYNKSGTKPYFGTSGIANYVKPPVDSDSIPNGICGIFGMQAAKYITIESSVYYKIISWGVNKTLVIRDSSYYNSDTATFQTAMSGVMLDYELATPLVYEVDDFTLPARYKVNDWGTEEQLQASGANGIAAIISCLYGVNAVDILRNLPKNYISTESMDNFLAALGSAMGGTWTKTWNDNDDEYNFSFTANALTNSLTSNQEDI